MKCGEDKVYRVDASCQKQCGEIPGQHGACDEEPAEGCACRDGLYLLGDKCVPESQCGCEINDIHGKFIKTLQVR